MESKAKFLGHGVHPMLVVFPLGLLATASIFDLIALLRGVPSLFVAAFWMIAAGVIGGVLASVFGLIDWFAIPAGTRAKNIGFLHAVGNGIVLASFALSWWLRKAAPADPSAFALAFSFSSIGISFVTAWLGGELVDRLGVGIDDGAHLNAPSSLSGRPANEGLTSPVSKRVA